MTAPSGIEFHKMHGAGNDFVLIDLRQQAFDLDAETARELAQRRTGIGCDQILLLAAARNPANLASYAIRNADGSAAGQCGNGARCIGLFLQRERPELDSFQVESPAGEIVITPCADGEFELDMGLPRFQPEEIPVQLTPEGNQYRIVDAMGELQFSCVSMGNPHAVLVVSSTTQADAATLARRLTDSACFSEGVNVGLAEIVSRSSIRLRVVERGAGETLACGSGACAAVVALRRQGLVDAQTRVQLPGGRLVITWPGEGQSVRMKGPATYLFKGFLNER